MEWLNFVAALGMIVALDLTAQSHPWFAGFVALTLVVNLMAWLLSIEPTTEESS